MAPAPYLFIASMDVEPEKLDLFNEVYDTEHVPMLMKVPGVVEISRLSKEMGVCADLGNSDLAAFIVTVSPAWLMPPATPIKPAHDTMANG